MFIRSLILIVPALLWVGHAQASIPLEAENGDIDPQNEIGFFYELGLGVKQDTWVAESWYERVREQDYCLADTLATGRLEVPE